VLNLIRGLALVLLLAVPLFVMFSVPRVFELFEPIPSGPPSGNGAIPAVLPRPTLDTGRGRFAPVIETPPPTLVPAPPTATPAPPVPGERAIVVNTNGRGAVLRAAPISGSQVAALRERQVVFVLDRSIVGDTEWAHVRTAEGAEGWVIGVVVQPEPEPR
jgi:hypothetical protein